MIAAGRFPGERYTATVQLGRLLKRQFFTSRLRRRWFIAALSLTMSMLPMVGTLGYFSAFILSPILSLLAIGVGLDSYSALQKSNTSGSIAIRALIRDGLLQLTWLWSLSLGSLFLAILWTRNCDVWGGFLFYWMGPGCSSIAGWICGVIGGWLGSTPFRRIIFGVAPFCISLAIGLWRLYHHPVVFAYDPFWGWFSGPIYDELVSVNMRYVWYRGYNALGWITAWLFITTMIQHKIQAKDFGQILNFRRQLLPPTLLLLVTLTIGWNADKFGFTATMDSIGNTLARTRNTEHFIIHYAPNSATAREIDAIAHEHEFAWNRLKKRLGSEPPYPVHSLIFPSTKLKRSLFGAGTVEVSLPWRGQMYLTQSTFPHRIFHHELAHAFSRSFGDSIFGLSRSGWKVNGALIEGFATALAPRSSNNLDLHDQAAILDQLKKRPSLGSLMGIGFWGRASSRAYTTAGSFCLWLLETQGPEKLGELYRSAGNFEGIYSTSLRNLEKKWLQFLRSRKVKRNDVAKQTQRFKRPSIFERPCAHRIADLQQFAAQARHQGRGQEATETYELLCELEPDQARHFLRLATVLIDDGAFDDARKVLEKASKNGLLSRSELSAIAEHRGDIEMAHHRIADATSYYQEAMSLHPNEARLRRLQLKLLAAQTSTPTELRSELTAYFAPFNPTERSRTISNRRMHAAARIREVGIYEAVGDYLRGLQLIAIAEPEQAAEYLESSLRPRTGDFGLPSSEIRRSAQMKLIAAWTQSGEFAKAQQLLNELSSSPEIRSGQVYDYSLWKDRIKYFEAHSAQH